MGHHPPATPSQARRSNRWSRALLSAAAAVGLSSLLPAVALAQPAIGGRSPNAAQRDARIRELEQIELDTRYRANPDVPPGQRTLVDVGAFAQFTYLSLDDAAQNNHGLRRSDFIPYLRLNFDGAQEVFLRGRIGYLDFNQGDSFDGKGDEVVDGDLDRGYYRFDSRRYNAAYGTNAFGAAPAGDFNLVFQGGRDLVYWGNGLVLGQTLDGVVLDLQAGALEAQLIAGVTPVRTVDFDTSRPAFDYNTRRGFYGAMVTANLGDFRPYAYGLIQRDYNKEDSLSLGFIDTEYNYNSYYLGLGATGAITDNLRFGIEATYEGGKTLSNSFIASSAGGLFPIEQTEDPIEAFAIDVRLDYFVNDVRQTRFSVEFLAASGDADRGSSTNTFNGNASGTTDHGFNGFGLINTGLALAPDPSNLLLLRVGVATLPLPDSRLFSRLQVGADFFVLGKLRSHAPIDEVTVDGEQFLGVEPDVYLNWQITSDLTLAVRYGVFFPSSDAFGANDDARQFLFAGLTFAF